MKNLTNSQKIVIIILLVIGISAELFFLINKFNSNKINKPEQSKKIIPGQLTQLNDDPNISKYIGKKILVRGKCKVNSDNGDPVITNVHLFFESVLTLDNKKVFKLKDKKGLGYWCPNETVQIYE
jgi:hypothetical protein